MTARRALVAVAGLLVVLAAIGFAVSEVRLRSCEDDRRGSKNADLITCDRSLFGEVRRGGLIARGREPRVPNSITLESTAFPYAATIPRRFGCYGEGARPPLRWSQVPERTRSLAILAFSGERAGILRWSVVDIPPGVRRLDGDDELPRGAVETMTSVGLREYDPPCTPSAEEPVGYAFTIYALERPLGLSGAATPTEVLAAVRREAFARGELSGQYDAAVR